MTLNKTQKILTVVYLILLICVLLFLTPYYYPPTYNIHFVEGGKGYGNFFILQNGILYSKLFTEIGVLTIIYSLLLIISKNKI
jgi:hypothetical protein